MATNQANSFTKAEDFLENKEFVSTVLGSDSPDQYIGSLKSSNPDLVGAIDEAISILQVQKEKKSELSSNEIDSIWGILEEEYDKIPEKRKVRFSLKYVAGIAVILAIGSALFLNYNSQNQVKKYTDLDFKQDQAQLILEDGSAVTLNKQSVIEYSNSGKEIIVDSKSILNEESNNKKIKSRTNQLVVPKGQRSFLTLEDGTSVWVNSGSRLIYPASFEGKNKRSVILVGEAFFKVKKDHKKPFIVKTEKLDVNVLGTSFNVMAYNDVPTIETVLIEGKVLLERQSLKLFQDKMELIPGQIACFNKRSNDISISEVNTEKYISWIDGMFTFQHEKLEDVMQKISRYYNVEFNIDQAVLNRHKISGKLDLKDSIDDVLNIVAELAPVRFEKDAELIHLKASM